MVAAALFEGLVGSRSCQDPGWNLRKLFPCSSVESGIKTPNFCQLRPGFEHIHSKRDYFGGGGRSKSPQRRGLVRMMQVALEEAFSMFIHEIWDKKLPISLNLEQSQSNLEMFHFPPWADCSSSLCPWQLWGSQGRAGAPGGGSGCPGTSGVLLWAVFPGFQPSQRLGRNKQLYVPA